MRHSFAATLIAAATLSACGPSVMYNRAPDVRIPAGARWAWGPADNDGLTRQEGAMLPPDSSARLIANAIETELVAKGYLRTAPESAQFIVHFHVGQRSVTDTLPPRDDPSPVGVRTGTWGGYGQPEDLSDRVVHWEEGTLVVDALTKDGSIVAWRGVIAGEIPPMAETRPAAAIRDAVRRLLRGFP